MPGRNRACGAERAGGVASVDPSASASADAARDHAPDFQQEHVDEEPERCAAVLLDRLAGGERVAGRPLKRRKGVAFRGFETVRRMSGRDIDQNAVAVGRDAGLGPVDPAVTQEPADAIGRPHAVLQADWAALMGVPAERRPHGRAVGVEDVANQRVRRQVDVGEILGARQEFGGVPIKDVTVAAPPHPGPDETGTAGSKRQRPERSGGMILHLHAPPDARPDYASAMPINLPSYPEFHAP